jgi:Family of unknown function (DUF5681)
LKTTVSTLILTVSTLLLMSCNGRPQETAKQAPVPQLVALPTATEVFHLRSECAKLSSVLLKDKEDDLAPWIENKNYAWWHVLSETSHYSPESNRCYVNLFTPTTSRHDKTYEEWSQELYDGQTKEMLAMTRIQSAGTDATNKQGTGSVLVTTKGVYEDTYKGASQYIQDMMKDGFGKPPRYTQFQKGRSGNPKGRPKGRKKNLYVLMEEVFEEKILVKSPKGTQSIPKIKAALIQLANKAASGDPRALREMLRLSQQREEKEPYLAAAPQFVVNFIKSPATLSYERSLLEDKFERPELPLEDPI